MYKKTGRKYINILTVLTSGWQEYNHIEEDAKDTREMAKH